MKKCLYLFFSVMISIVYAGLSPEQANANENAAWIVYGGQEQQLNVSLIGRYESGATFDAGGTEIVAYDPDSQRIYSVNGDEKAVDIINAERLGQSDVMELPLEKRVKLSDLASYLGQVSDITSVAMDPKHEFIAVAVSAQPKTDPGYVVFLDKQGNWLNDVQVGSLPDMVTFTPDGRFVLVANEGEPNDDYTVNPLGSVAMIAMDKEVTSITNDDVQLVTFEQVQVDDSIRKVHPQATYAEDLEPEYIVVDSSSKWAYVVLQENNAIAKLDLVNQTFTDVISLGYKDHSLAHNGFDASNKDEQVKLSPWPVLGMYQPDGISMFEQGGKTYILTPNEGDAQDYDGFSEEVRVEDLVDQYDLNAALFAGYSQAEINELVNNGLFNEEQLGRLKTTTSAPKNEDGKYEAVYAYGARSFTIWDAETMEPVYDSGNEFETILAEAVPDYFNTTNTEDAFDDRSDDKGPEPEHAVTGQVGAHTYAFIGLERMGGIMVYNIDNPENAQFDLYFSSRSFAGEEPAGDIAPEGLLFVAKEDSPTGQPLLLAAHEVSGTIAVYELSEKQATNRDKRTKITILHTNDSHSRVFEGAYDGMGFAKLSTLIKQHEAENKNTIILDAGDTFHGQTFATLEQGESIVKIMNEIGYDAMAAGNHDFNYGYERLLELAEMTVFPVISANIIYEDTGELVLPPYVIKEVDGIKLGIFGLSTPETHFKTHPKNVEGLLFTDPVEAAKKMVKELQDKQVDMIIALTHLGTDASSTDTSIKVAREVQGIDLIVDGHSHTIENFGENGTWIVSAGEYLKNLGVVELDFEGKELVNIQAHLITKEDAASIEPDPAVQAVIDSIEQAQQSILNEVVGETTVVLDGEREQVRTGETNLGNLITDAMLHVTAAQVAIMNGGGIRASIDQGEITKGDIITVLPFGNYIVTKYVTGADIKAALENGVDAYPNTKGAFPHVGGMSFKIDPDADPGNRVHSILIDGEQIQMDETYLLATNDFMAAGGDEYVMFAEYPIENEYPALDEAVIDYILSMGTIQPVVENRIVVEQAVQTEFSNEQAEANKDNHTKIYIVQKGDWLMKIARAYQTTWQELKQINNIQNEHLIYPGQKLIIP